MADASTMDPSPPTQAGSLRYDRRSHERVFTRLQTGDGTLGRIYSGALYLSHPCHRQPRDAGSLDVVCGSAWFRCRPDDSTFGTRFGEFGPNPRKGVNTHLNLITYSLGFVNLDTASETFNSTASESWPGSGGSVFAGSCRTNASETVG
jgi:hypothetical protein